MKSVNIRSLRHETSELMERVALGETVEIRRRDRPVAILKPVETEKRRSPLPDYRKRLQSVYGDHILPKTATELLAHERGER